MKQLNQLNLESLGVQEMTRQEMRETYGGGLVKEAIKKAAASIVACYDAVNDFIDGFNSVECNCN